MTTPVSTIGGCAVLMRGHSFRPPHDRYTCRPWGVDWRLGLDSHRKFLLDPAAEDFGLVDVYLCTYDNEHLEQIKKDYRHLVFEPAEPGASQKDTFLKGLQRVRTAQTGVDGRGRILDYCDTFIPYKLVVVCRFDLELKQCPWRHPGYRSGSVNFLWREWKEEAWLSHRRVPDAIHLVPGELLEKFCDGVFETNSDHCLHHVYDPVSRHTGGLVNVMIPDGFINSNTDVEPNPFYEMKRVGG